MRPTARTYATAVGLGLGVVFLAAGPGPHADEVERRWTVLAYLSGDGSLEASAIEYMRRLVSAPLTSEVAVAVQIDRCPGFSTEVEDFTDARRAVAVEPVGDAWGWRWTGWRSEVNMGDPRSLAEFLEWGVRSLPARHYLVLLVGHGNGIRPLTAEAQRRDYGVAYDATSDGDSLTPEEMSLALRAFAEATDGARIDVLAIDACFSASVEMACEAAAGADFMTGSPDLLYEPGVPWDEVLKSLSELPDMPAEAVANTVVEAVKAAQTRGGEPQGSYAAARLGAAAELQRALGALSAELQADMRRTAPLVIAARAGAPRSGLSGEMVDLGAFLRGLMQAAANSEQPRIAEWAGEAYGALGAMVTSAFSAGEPPEARRTWSVFCPPNLSAFPEDYLATSRFARESGWGAFLQTFLNHLQTLVSPTTGAAPREVVG